MPGMRIRCGARESKTVPEYAQYISSNWLGCEREFRLVALGSVSTQHLGAGAEGIVHILRHSLADVRSIGLMP